MAIFIFDVLAIIVLAVGATIASLTLGGWRRDLEKPTEFTLFLTLPQTLTKSVLLLLLLIAPLVRDLVTTSRACTGRLNDFSAACESAGPERQGEASSRAAVAARYMLSLT
jgi:hypothetical protein